MIFLRRAAKLMRASAAARIPQVVAGIGLGEISKMADSSWISRAQIPFRGATRLPASTCDVAAEGH